MTDHLKELLAQREALDKQIAEVREAEKRQAIENVRELIASYDLSPADCGFRGLKESPGAAPGRRATVEPKYRGPNGETWSGRGQMPQWLKALVAAGRSKDEFKI